MDKQNDGIFLYTCVKNEQDYLKDWIEYHLNLGFSKIFIFEDIDSDSHKEICDNYPDVILKPILDLYTEEERPDLFKRKEEGKFLQSEYAHRSLMWIKSNYEGKWIASLDCDEFVTLQDPTMTLEEALDRYSDYDAVMLYWQCYGANGHIKKPDYSKPIYEIYTQPCEYKESDKRRAVISKMFYSFPKLQDKFIWGVHTALCNWVRTDFGVHRTDEPCFDVMYLRHYITKSWEEWCWKLKTRGMFCKNNRKVEDFFIFNPDMDKDLLLKEKSLYL